VQQPVFGRQDAGTKAEPIGVVVQTEGLAVMIAMIPQTRPGFMYSNFCTGEIPCGAPNSAPLNNTRCKKAWLWQSPKDGSFFPASHKPKKSILGCLIRFREKGNL
jgi:hypothetical protein